MVEAKEAKLAKSEADKVKGQADVKLDKCKADANEQPDVERAKDSPVNSSIEMDENMDSNDIIDVGGRPLQNEAAKSPLLDQSNLHRDIPADLSRMASVTQQSQQHPINSRV